MNNNTLTILTIVLVVLLGITAVQAYQLTTLKSKLESNELQSSRVNTGASSGVSTPESIQDLPQMVGGC